MNQPYIITYSGKAFNLITPQRSQIVIEDIAHALARENRFNGHTFAAYGMRIRVGHDRGRDVTNEAAQLVWQLVMAEGGQIGWDMEDGSRMVLKAEKLEQKNG